MFKMLRKKEKTLIENEQSHSKFQKDHKLIFGSVCIFSVVFALFGSRLFNSKYLIEENSTDGLSIFSEFSVDFNSIRRERIENMKKYDYNYNINGIDRRSNLNLQEFYDVYDAKWPVIINDVVSTWPAFNWTRQFFHDKYGQERVAMKAVDSSLDNAVSLALPLHLFLKNIKKADFRTWTYVEDELFITMRPNLHKDIGSNKYLNEDWFQLFPEEIRPWNAMLLWGTKFSRSSLHIDPYNWTGTNAVLSGVKRWKLYPPGQDHLLYVQNDKLSGFPLQSYKYNSNLDAFDPDLKKYPLSTQARSIEFDQNPGEILFIPPGWFHQAFNKEETIAISSQVMNRNNYRIILEEILKVNNIRKSLVSNFDQLSPFDQILNFMSKIPHRILSQGKAVTKDALNQMATDQNQYANDYYSDSYAP